MVPTRDVDNSANCDVGTAEDIFIPMINTNKGTKSTPPPIPNKLEIIPAVIEPK